MQINSCLVWLLLAFVFVLTHARNVHFDFSDQFDDDSSTDEQQRPMFHFKRNLHKSSVYPKILFSHNTNEQNSPYEQDRSSAFARKAKAIVKGDPREFMG